MKVEVIRSAKGNLLVLVSFQESSNFHKNDATWVPTTDEINLIVDALQAITEYNKRRRD